MAQSKKHSLYESTANLVIGFILSVLVQVVVMGKFGVDLRLYESVEIVAIFSIVSFLRSYIIRRVFNKIN